MQKVIIVQVIYNTKRFIDPVFNAIFSQTYKNFEVVAVISGNEDGGKEFLAEKFPQVKIIDPGYNIGFAKGHNLVFQKYNADFFQLVNPDFIMEPNYIEEMLKVFQDEKVGAATGKLYQFTDLKLKIEDFRGNNIIDTTGVTISKSGRARDRGQHELDNHQFDNLQDVQAVSAAGAMYRASALDCVKTRRIGESENQSFKLYALDMPGFGSSPAPKAIWGVGDYAEMIKGFIEKLELKNAIVVGHSFGGRVGIKLAAKYSSLIEKLVLVDAAGFVTSSFKKDFSRFMAKLVKPLFKLPFTFRLRQKIYQFIGAEDYLATPELQKTFVSVVNEDLSEDMKKISCPTLIITGENDKDTPVEFGERMNKLIKESKFVVLPDSGHFSFLDQPEEFVKIFKEFV